MTFEPTRAHAVYSASGAHKWMACPASIKAEEGLPDVSSFYAEEGSAAHELAAEVLRGLVPDAAHCLGKVYSGVDKYTGEPYEWPAVDEEMVACVDSYVAACRATIAEAPEPHRVLVETKVPYTDYVPNGFGTLDFAVVQDGWVPIEDFKYGKGVWVDAEENPQLMLYALAVLQTHWLEYDIKGFILRVHQPRMSEFPSEWRITAAELCAWAEGPLQEAVAATKQENAPFVPGEKQCRFCKAKSTCKALADVSLEHAKIGFDTLPEPGQELALQAPDTLDVADLVKVLPHINMIKMWLNTIEARAHAILERGGEVPGYKLVEGRSYRKWVDPEAAERGLARKLKMDQRYKRTLISPAQAEKLLGKDSRFLQKHVYKPKGKATLAVESDSRPALEYNPAEGFAAITEEDENT